MLLPVQWWLRECWKMDREFTCSEHGNVQILFCCCYSGMDSPAFMAPHRHLQESPYLFSCRTSQKFKPNPSTNMYLNSAPQACRWARVLWLSHQQISAVGNLPSTTPQTTAVSSLTSQMLWELVGWFNMCFLHSRTVIQRQFGSSLAVGDAMNGTCISTLSQ